MNQQLTVAITIPIPEDHVLITKVELQELENERLAGVYWTMRDLENRTGRKQRWLKESLLYRPEFKKVLDAKSGGCVHYPEAQGQPWSFHAKRMAEFLDKNFEKIFN